MLRNLKTIIFKDGKEEQNSKERKVDSQSTHFNLREKLNHVISHLKIKADSHSVIFKLREQLNHVLAEGSMQELQSVVLSMHNAYQNYTFDGENRASPAEIKICQEVDFAFVLAYTLCRVKPEPSSQDSLPPPLSFPLVTPVRASQLLFFFEFAVHEWDLNLENFLEPYLKELGSEIRDEDVELAALLVSFGASNFDSVSWNQLQKIILNAEADSVQRVLNRLFDLGKKPDQIPHMRVSLDFLNTHHVEMSDILSRVVDEAIQDQNTELAALLLAYGAKPQETDSAALEKFVAEALENRAAREDINKYISREYIHAAKSATTAESKSAPEASQGFFLTREAIQAKARVLKELNQKFEAQQSALKSTLKL